MRKQEKERATMSEEAYIGECIHYRQIIGISADNMHIGSYIVQSADDRIYADYLQYRIGRISLSANFPNLDIVCTLGKLSSIWSKRRESWVMIHKSWFILPLTCPRRTVHSPELTQIPFNVVGSNPWEELADQVQNFHPPWTLYRSSLRSLDNWQPAIHHWSSILLRARW